MLEYIEIFLEFELRNLGMGPRFCGGDDIHAIFA